eukprot:11126422-Alexandrium_andersonii.AAC.1
MSASLVGSEMCIRDRRRPRPMRAMMWEELGELLAGEDLRGPPPKVARCCLLYTSDAADDM